ncbi:MAG: glycosyl hydrolase family 8, partial [Campylobacterota bacterium]|nr:glycosyl hydrolase family 8 [Campylobacterota bacterium]
MKALVLIIMMTSALFSSTPDSEVWNTYKKNFLQNDGRIIDFKNADITHTEGIGYALYFSYVFNDKESFERIHQWYHNNIKFNEHKLPGWKWGKAEDGTWKMLDKNSASDSNLWIAHALLLMYERHNHHAYKDEALTLLNAIKTHQIKSVSRQLFLLPGEKGFENQETLRLNLSYLIFETFEHFKTYDKDPIWQSLIESSQNQLMHMRFSALALNPDWLIYNTKNKTSTLELDNAMFSYDAIRIPLNIIRSSLSHKEKVVLLQPY